VVASKWPSSVPSLLECTSFRRLYGSGQHLDLQTDCRDQQHRGTESKRIGNEPRKGRNTRNQSLARRDPQSAAPQKGQNVNSLGNQRFNCVFPGFNYGFPVPFSCRSSISWFQRFTSDTILVWRTGRRVQARLRLDLPPATAGCRSGRRRRTVAPFAMIPVAAVDSQDDEYHRETRPSIGRE
jgi:hypothetical protein